MNATNDDTKSTQNNQQNQDELQKKVEELKKQEEEKMNEEAGAEPMATVESVPDLTEELKGALARALADLQNFKRRSEEDRGRTIRFANMELLKALLPVLNNLQRSADHLPEELKDNEWAKGVMGVHSDMQKSLEKLGVKKIPTLGEMLNPNLHEGLMSGPGKKDEITEEFEAGYLYYDEVISPAKVKVGDGTEAAEKG